MNESTSRLPALLSCLGLLLCLGLPAPLAVAEDDPPAPPKTDEAPKADESPKADEAPKAVPKGVTVKLISNGEAPRKELRYAPAAGSKLDFATSAVTESTSQMGQMKFGPIKTTVRVAFGKTEKRTIAISAEVTHAELVSDGSIPWAAQMKEGIEKTKGTKLSGSFSDCGIFKHAAGEGAPSAEVESLASQLGSLVMPLPQEAVGVGATWTVTAPITVSRIEQTSVITAKIEKIEGDRVELSFKEVRTARDTQMEMMGQKMPIKSIDGEGKGKVVIDLALGGVHAAESKAKTKMVMDMMGSEMASTSDMEASIKSKAPAATTKAAPAGAGAK